MPKRAQLPKTVSGSAGKTRAGTRKQAGSPVLLWVIIGAVALVVVGVVILQMQSFNKPAVASSRVSEGTAWGPVGAPVRVVQYSDFGCTYCRQFALDQGKQLLEEYGQTGAVRFEFRSFIIEGASTREAANASYCAADQGRFWDYHDLLFTRSGTAQVQVVFSKTALKDYGAQLGLDATQFNRCVDSGQHIPEVQNQHNEGYGLGVRATPTFFINNQKFEGALPYASLKAVVDAARAAAGS